MVGRDLGGRDPRALSTGKATGRGNRSDLVNSTSFSTQGAAEAPGDALSVPELAGLRCPLLSGFPH